MASYQKYVGSGIAANPVVRFSEDEGETWTAENTAIGGGAVTGLPSQSTNEYAQPMPMLCPNGDLLIHMAVNTSSTRDGTHQYRSTDDGATWSYEGKVRSDTTLLGGSDWCVNGSTLYATAFTDGGTVFEPPYVPVLLSSTDNGTSWSVAGTIVASGYNECSIDIMPNGDMVSVLRADSATESKQAVSTDGGATWGTPTSIGVGILQKPITKKLGDGRVVLSGRRVIGVFSGASDSVYGRQITEFYITDDNGATWQGPWTNLNGWLWGCGYTSTLERDNGDLYVLDYVSTAQTAGYIVEHVMGGV